MNITQFTKSKKNGLIEGKTGSAIYLFHYSRLYANDYYRELAMGLVREVEYSINRNSSLEYADGLAGIGSGLSYLVRNGFIEADKTDILLSKLDSLFFQVVYFGKHTNISRDSGLIGIGFYLLNRIENNCDDSIIYLRLKYLLLIVQDIAFACLGMEGFTYPYSNGFTLSTYEIKDCKYFLKKMLRTRLSPELTNKALLLIELSNVDEEDVFTEIENQETADSQNRLKSFMEQLAEKHENPIVKQLAALQLLDISLPPWWELF